MSGPDRRSFLKALAVAAVAGPAWVGRAFAADPTERQLELFASWHAARRRGVPLLAIVVPDDGLWERGSVVGPALVEASDALLAALSAYEPAAATRTGLHLLGAEVPAGAWFAIVHTDRVPAAVRAIGAPPPSLDPIDACAHHLERALGAGPHDAAAVAAGRKAWVTDRIPGSHWANAGGCGSWIEGIPDEEQVVYGCGMGSVPERAARFLTFVDR